MSTKPKIKNDDLLYRLLRDGHVAEFNEKKAQGMTTDLTHCDFPNGWAVPLRTDCLWARSHNQALCRLSSGATPLARPILTHMLLDAWRKRKEN